MKATVTETHEREVYAYLDRHELARLVASHVAGPHAIDLADKAVAFKVEFPEETEGSPSYRIGTAAKVRITVKLGGEA